MVKFPNIDWWCDDCDDYLNVQKGFVDDLGTWICTNCGHKNSITRFDIIDDFEVIENENESLNVYDAADIWMSNGFDEDYTFGYSYEELRNALNK